MWELTQVVCLYWCGLSGNACNIALCICTVFLVCVRKCMDALRMFVGKLTRCHVLWCWRSLLQSPWTPGWHPASIWFSWSQFDTCRHISEREDEAWIRLLRIRMTLKDGVPFRWEQTVCFIVYSSCHFVILQHKSRDRLWTWLDWIYVHLLTSTSSDDAMLAFIWSRVWKKLKLSIELKGAAE